jgi:ankyrin repeat protein
LAVEKDNEAAVKSLLAAGARADMYNDLQKRAPLHVAIRAGKTEMAKILLDFMNRKPRLNVSRLETVDRSGQTALHIAAESGDVKSLKFLLSRPELTDVDPKDLCGRQTPLYLAAKKSRGGI